MAAHAKNPADKIGNPPYGALENFLPCPIIYPFIMRKFFAIFICISLYTMTSTAQLTVTFPSHDSLEVTADWYPVENDLPAILLCHQNRYSRGEYNETAAKLNK